LEHCDYNFDGKLLVTLNSEAQLDDNSTQEKVQVIVILVIEKNVENLLTSGLVVQVIVNQ